MTDKVDDDSLEVPSEADCCNSGCKPCVFDLYEIRLSKWKNKVAVKKSSNVRYDLLSETKFKPFCVLTKTKITNDTYNFKFQPCIKIDVNSEQDIAGVLPYSPSQHFILKTSPVYFKQHLHGRENNCDNLADVVNDSAKFDYENKLKPAEQSFITRAYTPITLSTDENNCCFNIVIKLYTNGVMSGYIETLNVGDVAYFRGPYGDLQYTPNQYKRVIALCIGTGIAPIYTVIKHILRDENDETTIKLLYGCRTVDDIILRDELSGFSSYWNFNVKYFIGIPVVDHFLKKFGESFVIGRMDEFQLSDELKCTGYQDNSLVLICGTEEFNVNFSSTFIKFGFNKNNIHVF